MAAKTGAAPVADLRGPLSVAPPLIEEKEGRSRRGALVQTVRLGRSPEGGLSVTNGGSISMFFRVTARILLSQPRTRIDMERWDSFAREVWAKSSADSITGEPSALDQGHTLEIYLQRPVEAFELFPSDRTGAV